MGIPLLIPTHNEHTVYMRVLKVSNIPEVAVEFEHYRTQLYIYMYSYVCIASMEHRYSSTGFIHIITYRAFL